MKGPNMRFTQKQQKVAKTVKWHIGFNDVCQVSGDLCFLELMYQVEDKFVRFDLFKSREEVYDYFFPEKFTAEQLLRARTTETSVRLLKAKQALKDIVSAIEEMPVDNPAVANVALTVSVTAENLLREIT